VNKFNKTRIISYIFQKKNVQVSIPWSFKEQQIPIDRITNDELFQQLEHMIINTNIDYDSKLPFKEGISFLGLDSHNFWPNLHIIKIEKNCNPKLWKKYIEKQQEIISDSLTEEISPPLLLSDIKNQLLCSKTNECYLFHGTNHKNLSKILEKGLSEKKSSISGALGVGIYLTDNSCKALNYSRCSSCGKSATCSGCGLDKNFILLICRTMLGNIQIEKNKVIKPRLEPLEGYHSVVAYSSSIDKQSNFRFSEFVVYSQEQVYPEFIVYCQKLY